MTSRPAGFMSPFEGRSRRSSFSQIPVEPEPSHDDDGLPLVARSRTPWLAELMPSGTVSNLHEAEQAKKVEEAEEVEEVEEMEAEEAEAAEEAEEADGV